MGTGESQATMKTGAVLGVIVASALFASFIRAEDEKFDCEKSVKKQNNVIQSLTKMVMMLQLNAEESARTGGDSGIKQTRSRNIGTNAYHSSNHISNAVNSNHDHSQNRLTVGMGEVVAVINGVEFRTRHNDYQMAMPSTTSGANGAIEQIPLPEVPPAVLKQKTVEGQIKEMRAWFKAFKDQRGPDRANPDKRDFWNYFKPVLCYMEAGWTQSDESIEAPFESDRHSVEASTWWELTQKVRYTGNSGTKSTKENYSFLPMKIFSTNDNGEPVYAQWNYRILCHPLKKHVPVANLRVIDDLSNRMKNGKTLKEHGMSRRARFEVWGWRQPEQHVWERSYRRALLDDLMEEIPGKDNYGANLTDNSFGNTASKYWNEDQPINVGYYHRVYKGARGAMGGTLRNRGFSDRNIFMAKTTQAKVPSMTVRDCWPKGAPCQDYESKWSYAIPLEIIYLTPLYNWNPFNLTYAENFKTGGKWLYNKVTANGRNGGFTADKAYDGSRRNVFYRTPEAFFGGGGEIDKDPADTSKGTVGVLSPDGKVHKAVASGTRIMLPDIPGIGKLRTRYPISPLFNDGSQIYQEVEALRDIVLKQETYRKMLLEKPVNGAGSDDDDNTYVTLSMTMTHQDPPGLHTHTVSIHAMDLKDMMASGIKHVVDTTEANGHSHTLEIKYQAGSPNPWAIISCDGQATCWDGHGQFLVRID